MGFESAPGRPSSTWVAGRASSTSAATPTISTGIWWWTTNRAQRQPRAFSGSSTVCCAMRRECSLPKGKREKFLIRRPANPSMAGTSVREITSARNTAPAAATPMIVRNGMPTTASPHSAMMTVAAANTTEPPAVPAASPTAWSGGIPRSTPSRCRAMMNSP